MAADHFPQSWLLSSAAFVALYLAVRWDLVTGDAVGLRVFCTAFVFARLSLFSVADIHANGFHSSLSCLLEAALSGVETQWVSGESARTFFRDQWSRTGTTEWMRVMNALYTEFMYCEIKMRFQSWHAMPLLICILYVLIGFHQLVPSLFHFPRLPPLVHPLPPFSTIWVSSVCRYLRKSVDVWEKENRGVILW